jgi:hypothetical protein
VGSEMCIRDRATRAEEVYEELKDDELEEFDNFDFGF